MFQPPTPTSAPSRGSVLLVEDDDAIRDLVAEVLRMRGYQVYAAADGDSGLAILKAVDRISVVLLDLMMPRLGGAEFVERVRASPEPRCRTPIVLVTAAHEPGPLDVDGLLEKPFELEKLLAMVRRHTGGGDAPRAAAGR